MTARKLKSKKKKVFEKKLPKKSNPRKVNKKVKSPTISGQALGRVKIKAKAKTKKKIKTLKKHKTVLRRVKKSPTRKKTAKKKIIPRSRKLAARRGKNKITKRKTLGISKKKAMKTKAVKRIKKIEKKKTSTTVKRKLLKSTIKRVNKTKKIRERKKLQKTSSQGVAKYFLNHQFQFIDELRDLVLKSSPDEMNEITRQLSKVGKIKLAVATGIFLNRVNSDSMTTDLFIVVDDIDRRKFRSLLHSMEAELGREIRYVIMEKEEFRYRLSMFDRFIRVLLESPHEKLINHLGV